MLTQQWVPEDTYVKQLELAWDRRYFALALENLFMYGNDKENDTDKEVVATIVHAAVGGCLCDVLAIDPMSRFGVGC